MPRVAWLEKNSRSSNQSAPNNDGLADEVNALLPRISQLEKSQNQTNSDIIVLKHTSGEPGNDKDLKKLQSDLSRIKLEHSATFELVQANDTRVREEMEELQRLLNE